VGSSMRSSPNASDCWNLAFLPRNRARARPTYPRPPQLSRCVASAAMPGQGGLSSSGHGGNPASDQGNHGQIWSALQRWSSPKSNDWTASHPNR